MSMKNLFGKNALCTYLQICKQLELAQLFVIASVGSFQAIIYLTAKANIELKYYTPERKSIPNTTIYNKSVSNEKKNDTKLIRFIGFINGHLYLLSFSVRVVTTRC